MSEKGSELVMVKRIPGVYEKYIKRGLDIICSLFALVFFCWLYGIIALLVRYKLGAPIIFKQPRPGIVDYKTGKEKIFYLYKFRTMTEEKDENGHLLPDDKRLTPFGKWLRRTSLDELPEAINILKGDMSVIGPRPQLVRDLVFMSEKQRMRHTARPGLSGLAQVMGRNAITWEEKFEWDLRYIENVSFLNDIKLVWLTIKKVFLCTNTTTQEEAEIALDFGDALLMEGKITQDEYDTGQAKAKELLVLR